MLKTSTTNENGTLVITLEGRIDATSAKELEEACSGWIGSGETNLVMDFQNVDFISSAGLRVILLAAKLLKTQNGSIKLCSLSPTLRDVFEISGFSKLFLIYPNLSDAL